MHIKKYHVNKAEEKIPCELCGALYAATSLVGHMYSVSFYLLVALAQGVVGVKSRT